MSQMSSPAQTPLAPTENDPVGQTPLLSDVEVSAHVL